jgi:hypothetical protein
MRMDEIDESIIHEDHPILSPELEDRVEVLGLSSDDQIADTIVVEHDLTSDDHPGGIAFWQ